MSAMPLDGSEALPKQKNTASATVRPPSGLALSAMCSSGALLRALHAPARCDTHPGELVSSRREWSVDLVRGRHGRVELAESGDERRVHVLRVHLAPAELEVRSGARVRNERDLEAEVRAGARGRVDAHAGHHPG